MMLIKTQSMLMRSIRSIGSSLVLLALTVKPSPAEADVREIQRNPNETWIQLQQQGEKGDRQMQFIQLESLTDDIRSPYYRSEPPSNVQTLQQRLRGQRWHLRWLTVNESAQKPGYMDAAIHVNCETKQLQIIDKREVFYKDIQSPEDELAKAIHSDMKMRPHRSIGLNLHDFTGAAPWQTLASTDRIYQFVCQKPTWRQRILEKAFISKAELNQPGFSTLPQTELAQAGFPRVNAGGTLPQHLFFHAWRTVWQDGLFPQTIAQPTPNPALPDYLETLRTAKGWENKFIGPNHQLSKVFEAFQQAAKAGETIRPELEQILQSGTPAGKMYAIVILAKYDSEAANQILETMRNDPTVVLERTGDFIGVKKVSEWAVSTLNAKPYHAALPSHLLWTRVAREDAIGSNTPHCSFRLRDLTNNGWGSGE